MEQVHNSVNCFINWLHKPLNLLLFLLSLVPIISIFMLVAIKGVNIPYADQWDTSANVAIKTAERSLTLMDLVTQHGDHRHFFSKLLTAIVTLTSGWNTKVEMYVSVILAVFNLVLLISLFRFDHPEATGIIIIPFSLLVFSFRQYRNWLWGFETSWFFGLFFFYAALWVVRRSQVGWRPIAIASILSFCATYSIGLGMLTWPLLFVVLLIFGYRHWKYLGFWLGAAILTLLLFLKDYSFSENTNLVFEAGPLLRFMAAYLGSPFIAANGAHHEIMMKPWLVDQSMVIGIGGGLIFLVNVIYLLKKKYDWTQLTSGLALAGFSLTVSLLIAVTRAYRVDIYPPQALESRYVTASTPFWISFISLLVLTVLLIIKDEKSRVWEKLLSGVNIAASVIIVVLYVNANIDAAGTPPRVTEDQKQCMLEYTESRNIFCIFGMFGNQFNKRLDTIWQLAKYRLSVFAEVKESIVQQELTRPIPTSNDYIFVINEPSSWKYFEMMPEKSTRGVSWVVGTRPRMVYTQPLDLCLSDYTHLMIVMSVSPGEQSNAGFMLIYFQLDDKETYEEPISFVNQPNEIPFEYFYDLEFLNLDPETRLVRFRLDPVFRGSQSGDTVVTIYDLRLIRSSETSQCTD